MADLTGQKAAFLAGGGEMGALIRAHDWASTPLGPVDGWSQTLCTLVQVILGAAHPMLLIWGDKRTVLYNDPSIPMWDRLHPSALGASYLNEVLQELRGDLGPLVDKAFYGETVQLDNLPVTFNRKGYMEESIYTFSYTPVKALDGTVEGLLLPIIETSGQVFAERKLRELNETLEQQVAARTAERNQIWQVSRDMLLISDAHGRWLSVNPAWTRVLGWTEQELVGRTSEWLEHPEDHAKTRAEISRLADSHLTLAFENRFRARDGSYHTLAWSAVPADGLIYCTARDVTAEKASAAALRLFGNIVQSDKAPILAYGHDLRVIGFNQSHEEAFVRVMGRHQTIGDFLPGQFPPEQEIIVRDFMERALSGETFSVIEKLGDPQHEEPTWEITYSPLRDEYNTIFGAFHVARDISEWVQAQEELAGTQEALRQSQKLEAVGQLTGGVAHDFNNLLTIIRSSVDFLRRPDLPEARKARYIDAVSETVDRAAKLTSQLLAFARRQTLLPEIFEVGRKLQAVGDMLDTVTGSRIRLVIEASGEPCFIRADLSQFETALINMAVNARDAMNGEGRLTLRLLADQPMPAIRGHAAGHAAFAAVSVVDTGSGIAPGQLGRIFEPFFTTKEVGKGTGLGLSQVFGFAKQSGGDVDVQSVVGEGTTFTLYLPQEAAPADRGTDVAEAGPSPLGAGQRVLIVEDNTEVGRFCTQTLEDLGYVTVWAANAEDALDKLGADGNGFDVVFSDVVMPGMGGVALAEAMRERLPLLPVVLTSGYSHVLARKDDHGFELLHKPYSADQLARVLKQVIAKANAVSCKVLP